MIFIILLVFLLKVVYFIEAAKYAYPMPPKHCSGFSYGTFYGKNVGFLELEIKKSDLYEPLKLDIDFYAPDNITNILINVTLINSETVLQNICSGQPITFMIQFPHQSLNLASGKYPNFNCNKDNQFEKFTVKALYEQAFSTSEINYVCENIWKNSGLNDEGCGIVDDQLIRSGDVTWPWIGTVLINGESINQVVFITKTRAIGTGLYFKHDDLSNVKVVMPNNKIFDIWRYERLHDNVLLFLWPGYLNEHIIPVCFYILELEATGEVFEKVDERNELINSEFHNTSDPDICIKLCGKQHTVALTNTRDVCMPCWVNDDIVHGTNLTIKETDEGGGYLKKINNKWYLHGTLNVFSGKYNVYDVTPYFLNVISFNDQNLQAVISPCKQIFKYKDKDGKNFAILEATVSESKIFEFNVLVEFYIPTGIYFTQKTLNVTVEQRKKDDYYNDHERTFQYTIYFPKHSLPVKRIFFEDQLACDNPLETYKNNAVMEVFHYLISDPNIRKEYENYDFKRTITNQTCGTFGKHQYPWVAESYTETSTRDTCTATFISKFVAVTAATQSCWDVYDIRTMYLRLFNDQIVKVIKVLTHPKFYYNKLSVTPGFSNNVALLLLDQEIDVPSFNPICLWKDQNADADLIGLNGKFLETSRTEHIVQIVPIEKCNRFGKELTENSICVKIDHACKMRSGAFIFENDGKWYLRGIYNTDGKETTQYRPAGCLDDYSVFTDASDYYDWFSNTKQQIRSPCPEIFQYGEENGKIVAFVEVPALRSQVYGFTLSLEFVVPKGEPTPSEPLNITLRHNEEAVIQKILTKGRILYVVTFPDEILPLNKIIFSGQLICKSQEDFGRNPSILTIFHESKPSLSLISQYDHYTGGGVNEKDCGNLQRNHTALSVGGESADKRSWPWVVSMYIKGKHACTASLITKSVAVTAAHCVKSVNITDIILKLFNDQEAKVWRQIIHFDYRGSTLNDIALLLLDEDINTADFTPICVWPFSEKIDNLIGTLVGYGATEVRDSGKLNQIDLTAVSSNTCRDSDERLKNLANENSFCATGAGDTGPCHGDSGGGFAYEYNSIWYLRGVVSTSLKDENDFCDTNNYAIFMDTEKYFDWIKDANKTRLI